MEVVESAQEIRKLCESARQKSLTIGFVPTMGYLHDGHISLVKHAKETVDVVIVSIFVNPTQFGANEDFDKYPRDLYSDKKICEQQGVDYIFIPTAQEIYGGDYTKQTFPYDNLTNKLCGVFRPTHFDGVLDVMDRFFAIIKPDVCFMGNKDAQQLVLINKLANDYYPEVQVQGCPIIREIDNVALSSRNVYLNDQERELAKNIYAELMELSKRITLNGSIKAEIKNSIDKLAGLGFIVQYLELIRQSDLNPVDTIFAGKYLLAVAVICGRTRLIDNFSIEVESDGYVSVDSGVIQQDNVMAD